MTGSLSVGNPIPSHPYSTNWSTYQSRSFAIFTHLDVNVKVYHSWHFDIFVRYIFNSVLSALHYSILWVMINVHLFFFLHEALKLTNNPINRAIFLISNWKKKKINYHVSCSFICEKFEEKKNDPKNCYLILPFSLQSYVREQILQTVAVILKRGTVELKSSNTDRLFEDISQLISSGNVTMVGSHVLHLFIYRLHMKKWAAKSYKHHSCRYMKNKLNCWQILFSLINLHFPPKNLWKLTS